MRALSLLPLEQRPPCFKRFYIHTDKIKLNARCERGTPAKHKAFGVILSPKADLAFWPWPLDFWLEFLL
jgi:hypothetical protein